MDHATARALNLDAERGTLSPERLTELQEHLSSCPACRRHAQAERALSEVLAAKLPRHAAPVALKRRLAERWPTAAQPRPKRRRTFALAGALAALVAIVAGSTALLVQRHADVRQLETETVNDHLRLLEGIPLAKVTGGLHEVKPWFGGKLDFAPAVRFAGDADFPLEGGAVEPFLDRRAAVFVYRRRLHTATLFVVRSEGLAFPGRLTTRTVRGFTVALWSEGDQGFALVSDLNPPELLELQRRIASP